MKSIFARRRMSPIRELEEQLAGLRSAAPFVPTPWSIARRMLEMAEVGPDDTVYAVEQHSDILLRGGGA